MNRLSSIFLWRDKWLITNLDLKKREQRCSRLKIVSFGPIFYILSHFGLKENGLWKLPKSFVERKTSNFDLQILKNLVNPSKMYAPLSEELLKLISCASRNILYRTCRSRKKLKEASNAKLPRECFQLKKRHYYTSTHRPFSWYYILLHCDKAYELFALC